MKIMDAKKFLATALKELGLVPERFTGQLTLNMSEGGVSTIERKELLK